MKFMILSVVYQPSRPIRVHGIENVALNKLKKENKIISYNNSSYVTLYPPQIIVKINCNNGTILDIDIYHILVDMTKRKDFNDNFIEYLNQKLVYQKFEKEDSKSFEKVFKQILSDII